MILSAGTVGGTSRTANAGKPPGTRSRAIVMPCRAGLRNEEILANWERARKNEPLLDIEPLP
jgi:hypothetical protein